MERHLDRVEGENSRFARGGVGHLALENERVIRELEEKEKMVRTGTGMHRSKASYPLV
jgi:hypothetical protein